MRVIYAIVAEAYRVTRLQCLQECMNTQQSR